MAEDRPAIGLCLVSCRVGSIGLCKSGEHLRRLCKKALGRSPMQQLTFLRMEKASQLLLETDEKIETIARMTGYKNAFHFSNVFMEWVGIRPSEFRG